MRGRARGRVLRFVPALVLGALWLVVAGPSDSATGTTASFTLTAGSLTITQPATATLGVASTGALTLSGSLGTVSVSDGRGLLTATWTASVVSTNFTTGGGSTYETVTASNIAYASGTAITTGVGVFTPGVLASMSSSGTAGSWAGNGDNTASWNPTITFTLSPSQVAGTYSGTVTHSVA